MKINLEKYDKNELMNVIYQSGFSCEGKIISSKSKYYGKTFAVSSSGYWGVSYVTLKVQPINRNYTYNSYHVELTQESIDYFKKQVFDTLNGAIDFFKRPIKTTDIIFYKSELYKVAFFVKGKETQYSKVAIEAIRTKREWDSFEDMNSFIPIEYLAKSILIDDPLLLLKI